MYSRATSEFIYLVIILPIFLFNYYLLVDNLITGSFDRTIRTWDPRSPTPCTGKHALPERVYQMDIAGTNLVIGMAGRQFHIFDVRKIKEGEEPVQKRESSLKYMTRALACMSDGQGLIIFDIFHHHF